MVSKRKKRLLSLSIALLFIASLAGGGFAVLAQDMSTLVIALAGSPPTFDPLAASDSRVDTPSINLYNTLLQYLPGVTEWELELAESYEQAEDGLSYTFTLKPGVMFHDGTEVMAEDVKYSVDRLVAVNIGVARSLVMVTGADVIDDYTVQINLSTPFPGFLGALSRLYILNSELVMANSVDDDWGQTWLQNNDAGSGPYVLTSFTPEQEFTIERFDDYFKGWEGNHVDRAIFAVIKEESTRRLSLENGDSHWIQVGSPETLDALSENPAYTINTDPTLNQLYFAMNSRHPILSDARVRKALSLVYDFEGHVELARNGYAAIAKGVLPPGIVCFDGSTPESAMDVEAAQALMAEAGYADGGFELTMAYQGTSPEETAAMQIMQAGAAQLGITIRPMAIEWPAKVQAYSSQETAPDVGTVWMFPSLPDPDQFFGRLGHSDQGGGGGINFSWYSNADNDALLEAGKVELDPEARCEIYKQVQAIWDEETPYVNVVVGMALSASHANVKGYQWSPPHSYTQNVYQIYIDDM
ncbi:MAG: ABC transporter substrate-binding protein [Chloroflexota bacterium]|nr:ABC transporter substrate-binding protein [Chloroflexota bacterium]